MKPTRRQMTIIVLAITVAVLVIVLTTAIVTSAIKSTSIRETQTSNTPLLQNSNETLKRIRECTTPGEKCFDEGQARTAEIVSELTSNITRVSAYAAACADRAGVQGEDEIFACVVLKLSEPAKP